MIEAKDIIKKYGKVTILNNINLKIGNGDRVAIVGSNGAGKTTLIETMLGITKPTSGQVNFDFDYKVSPLEKIGIQFQDAMYPPNLMVKEIIEFFIDVSSEKIDQNNFDKMLEIFEIKDFLNRDASWLSGGQKQKLNLFLAIVTNPQIVLLDELTTGLDIKVSKSITNFIEDYIKKNGKTMILVSHKPYEIEMLCNRIVVMQHGTIVYDKSVASAMQEHGSISKLMFKYV